MSKKYVLIEKEIFDRFKEKGRELCYASKVYPELIIELLTDYDVLKSTNVTILTS